VGERLDDNQSGAPPVGLSDPLAAGLVGRQKKLSATSTATSAPEIPKRAYPISVNPLVRRGALGGIRTPNLLIRSQVLYPLSYERATARPKWRACPSKGTACRSLLPRVTTHGGGSGI
jgi:hypothetical protein